MALPPIGSTGPAGGGGADPLHGGASTMSMQSQKSMVSSSSTGAIAKPSHKKFKPKLARDIEGASFAQWMGNDAIQEMLAREEKNRQALEAKKNMQSQSVHEIDNINSRSRSYFDFKARSSPAPA